MGVQYGVMETGCWEQRGKGPKLIPLDITGLG